MRNRLLPLAVLAIALGLAAAAYADIVVTTVVVDPVTGTWDVREKLWGNAGIGTPAASLGAYDFLFGLDGVDGGAVLTSTNVAPQSAGVQEGFFLPSNADGLIAKNGKIVAGNVSGITSWQNALYGDVYDAGLAARVYNKVGIQAGPGNAWDADVKLATGTYNKIGSLALTVPGRIGFSVLLGTGPTFTDPMTTIDSSTWVQAVVTQTIFGAGAGNGGGVGAYTRPTAMTVQAGEVGLGVEAQAAGMGQFLALNIDSGKSVVDQRENASVKLLADQSVKSVDIKWGQLKADGITPLLNGLDLNGNALRIYGDGSGTDLTAAEQAIQAALLNTQTTPLDGVYDSSLSVSTKRTIGTMITDEGSGPVLLVKAVQWGDANMDNFVNIADVGLVTDNWNTSGGGAGAWWKGDINRDGFTNIADVGLITDNWNTSGTVPAGLVPEPTTLLLLAGGAICGLVRRRRSAR